MKLSCYIIIYFTYLRNQYITFAKTTIYTDVRRSAICTVTELLRKIKYNKFIVSNGWNILQRIITGSLAFGAFFLQFLTWCNQENYDRIL